MAKRKRPTVTIRLKDADPGEPASREVPCHHVAAVGDWLAIHQSWDSKDGEWSITHRATGAHLRIKCPTLADARNVVKALAHAWPEDARKETDLTKVSRLKEVGALVLRARDIPEHHDEWLEKELKRRKGRR